MVLSELMRHLYEDIEPRITAVRRLESGLQIDIACDELPEGERRFRITAEEVLEERLVPSSFGSLSLHEEHPLLLEWRGDHRILSFSTAPEIPEAVVGRLYETHDRVCGDWRPFSNYVNDFNGKGLSALLKTGFGMLAQGPGPLLQAYQNAVSGLLKTSLTVPRPSSREDFKVLFFDDQYVLARDFRSEEIAVSGPPNLDLGLNRDVVDDFVQGLQRAIDEGDADRFNLQFAGDVLWGSPFGAVAPGYDVIHAIHARMFGSAKPVPGTARFQVEHVRSPAENVVVAHVRRVSRTPGGEADPSRPGSFDELALFVLVKREERWWLAAAQHVPDRRDVYAQGA